MMGKKLRERVTAFLLAAAVLLSPVTTVEAETDVPLDDYEEIVATHSIDASVPSYGDYIAQFDDVHPDETYVVDAADYVRFAAGDGTVSMVGSDDTYPLIIEIEHGNGYQTRYMFLQAAEAKQAEGEQVQIGTALAAVDTDNVQVDYQVIFEGQPIDPLIVFEAKG